MLDGPELDRRFAEFISSLQDGDIIIDGVMFFAYLTPGAPSGTTGYGQAVLGDPPLHHILGLVDVGRNHLEAGDDD